MEKILEKVQIVTKYLLFLTALSPLLLASDAVYPFITGKAGFFRSIVEIAFALFLTAIFFGQYRDKWKTWRKNPLLILVGIFLISIVTSVIFAADSNRAFWGDMERAEGLFGLIHFFAFFAMTWTIFKKEDWLIFLKATISVGAVNVFYGFLQYFGVKSFPFITLISKIDRPGAFIGNSAFFAAYLILISAISVTVFFKSKSLGQKFWQYFSAIVIMFSIIMVFFTGTRGAILGLVSGALFLLIYFATKSKSIHYKKLSIQKFSITLLILGIIFSGTFWFTRTNSVWQNVPGFNRLARTNFFDGKDPSTQTRLMLWQTGIKEFKERPVFGWGQDNYGVASLKYFNPDQELYGEAWFDRAHNKIVDILVMQGIFGLLAYLGIFVAIFYSLVRISKNSGNFYFFPLVSGLVIAYFVQNLFVFEDFNVNSLFFTLLGFLAFGIFESKLEEEGVEIELMTKTITADISAALASIIAVALAVYGIYNLNFVPYVQAKYALASTATNDKDEIISNLNKAFYPDNFSQVSWRSYVVDDFYNLKQDVFERKELQDLAGLLEQAVDKAVEADRFDIRWHVRKNQISNIKAKNDPKYYIDGEEIIRKAIEMAPQRQELYYGLAFSLAGQERFNEAIEAAKFAVQLSPDVSRAQYHLALMYAVGGKSNEAIDELENLIKSNPFLEHLLSADRQGIVLIYTQLNRVDRIVNLIIRRIEGKTNLDFERKYYYATFNYFIINRDAENAIKVAEYLADYFDLKDEMDVFIDLLQKKDWIIIESLF